MIEASSDSTAVSTGANLRGTLQVAREMMEDGRKGSVVTLICDSGQRYLDKYCDPAWVAEKIGNIRPWRERLARFGAG